LTRLLAALIYIGASDESLRYVHVCFKLVFLGKMSANNPSQKSVVLELFIKKSKCYQSGSTEDSRTTDSGRFWPV